MNKTTDSRTPTVQRSSAPWPPLPPDNATNLPSFPVAALPEPLKSWVTSTAQAYQVPYDLPALLALAVCGGAVARRIEVSVRTGWFEPLNLFVVCVLGPANRKSAVFNAAMGPLKTLEEELIAKARPSVSRSQTRRRIMEGQLKRAEKRAIQTEDPFEIRNAEEAAARLDRQPEVYLPKLFVEDATSQSIQSNLGQQNGRLILASSEGGVFQGVDARKLDCFLKGHAGDGLLVDRATKETIRLQRCCLTVACTIQPEVETQLAGNTTFRGTGLLARFLWAKPLSLLGSRDTNPTPVPEEVLKDYDTLVRHLASFEIDPEQPVSLNLSPEGQSSFAQWEQEVETMLGNTGRLRNMKDWGGKLCGHTARLAGIIHLVKTSISTTSTTPINSPTPTTSPTPTPPTKPKRKPEPWKTHISQETVESAIAIARWAIEHAEAVFGLFGAKSETEDDAGFVLRWIRKHKISVFTPRDVQANGRSRFDGNAPRRDQAIQELVKRDCIRPIEPEPEKHSGKGRKAGPSFEVHPGVHVETSLGPIDLQSPVPQSPPQENQAASTSLPESKAASQPLAQIRPIPRFGSTRDQSGFYGLSDLGLASM